MFPLWASYFFLITTLLVIILALFEHYWLSQSWKTEQDYNKSGDGLLRLKYYRTVNGYKLMKKLRTQLFIGYWCSIVDKSYKVAMFYCRAFGKELEMQIQICI